MTNRHTNYNPSLGNLSCAHLNVRSILTNNYIFRDIMDTHNFDVIAITETHLNENSPSNALHVPGYNFYRKDRPERGGGGIGVYVNNLLCPNIVSFDLDEYTDVEYMFFKLKTGNIKLFFVLIYSPHKKYHLQVVKLLDAVLPEALISSDVVVILGDLNVNMFNLNNSISRCMDSHGFTQLIAEATRVAGTSATLIDPIFINNKDIVTNSGTVEADVLTDHKLVFCRLSISVAKHKQKYITFRDFKNLDMAALHNDLLTFPWDSIFYMNDIDKKVDYLTTHLNEIFDIHCPLRTVRVSKPPAPWLTANLKIIFAEKKKALLKYKANRSLENWNYFKIMRNYALASERREKMAYLEFLRSQKSSRDLWKALRGFNFTSDNKAELPQCLTNPSAVNDYFMSVYNTNGVHPNVIQFYSNNRFKDNILFSFKLPDCDAVLKAILSLKSNSHGSDNISLLMIKHSIFIVLPHITHIINCCLEVGYFPMKWKEAIVCAVPKISNPTSVSDLRPISLLPALSKILEKIVYLQAVTYFNDSGVLPAHQSGFRKGHSTSTALLNLTDSIFRAIDSKLATILVSLDYSKAFDKICHSLICAKLLYYGFDKVSVSFFKSYLTGRSQKVCINNRFSSSTMITSGVPQGSILGPLLFIIYTASMFSCTNPSKIFAYADDTQLIYSFISSEFHRAGTAINEDLDSVLNFSTSHNLSLNTNKSVAMLFSSIKTRSFLKSNISVRVGSDLVPFSTKSKILGVILDDDLRFTLHTNQLLQKTYVSLKTLYSNRYIMNFKMRKKLCEALILPILHYCNIVYYPCLDSVSRNRIQRVQNTCVRLIFGLRKYDHVSHKLGELKWLRMVTAVKLHYLVFIHRLLHTSVPSYLRERLSFRCNIHDRLTRHSKLLNLPLHSTALFRRSFSFNAVTLYNKIPPELLPMSSVQFRRNILTSLLRSDGDALF